MNLTEHFTLEELTFSSTAIRLGIDNGPTPDIIDRLRILAARLEDVRALLGHPIHIDSGYRCSRLNRAVGGVGHSAHMDGYAADIICPAYGTPMQVARAIVASPLSFDQVIYEGTWCHLSVDPLARRQTLTATFTASGPIYSPGIPA